MSILIKPEKIQLYAGEEAQETYILDLTPLLNNLLTLKPYASKIIELEDKLKKLEQDKNTLTSEKNQLQTKLNEEQKAIQKLEKDKQEYERLNSFLTSQKVVNLTELGDKIKDLEKRPTQEEFDKVKTKLTNDATSWKSVYELERDKAKGFKNEIDTILNNWRAINLTDLSSIIQDHINERDKNLKDLLQEQNKNKQLEIRITNKDNIISQKIKTIQTLQLKNEKLSVNQKKLYGYLGEVWKLISHLQKDLSATQQDKAHIQQELNDALTILNKPTSEMGTQTDLTAEQISQMEKDLEYFRKLLREGADEIGKLEQELLTVREEQTKKEKEINNLQTKVKDLTPNYTENQLLIYIRWKDWDIHTEKVKRELETGQTFYQKWDWNQLGKNYSEIRNKLLELANSLLKEQELGKEIKQKNEELEKQTSKLTELQTKYDIEVRSKEELVKYLNIYRKQCCIDLRALGYIYERNGVEKKSNKVNEELNKTFIEIIKQSTYPYSLIIYETGKLPFVFPKDKLAEQKLIIKTIYPHDKKIIEVERGERLWKEQPTLDKLHTNQIFNPNYGTQNGHFYLDFISNDNIEIKVVD